MQHSSRKSAGRVGRFGLYLRSACLRSSLLVAGWWALCEGDASGWPVGAPLIGLALFVSLALEPPKETRWTALGLLRFAGFFIWGSLLGGVDVAQRALRPSLPIYPGLMRYPLRLPEGAPQAIFLVALSLMPGSLGTHIEEGQLVIHVLVADEEASLRSVSELEHEVARLFRIELGGPNRPGEVRDA